MDIVTCYIVHDRYNCITLLHINGLWIMVIVGCIGDSSHQQNYKYIYNLRGWWTREVNMAYAYTWQYLCYDYAYIVNRAYTYTRSCVPHNDQHNTIHRLILRSDIKGYKQKYRIYCMCYQYWILKINVYIWSRGWYLFIYMDVCLSVRNVHTHTKIIQYIVPDMIDRSSYKCSYHSIYISYFKVSEYHKNYIFTWMSAQNNYIMWEKLMMFIVWCYL